MASEKCHTPPRPEVLLKKAATHPRLEPGTWGYVQHHGVPEAIVSCPRCGGCSHLQHEVAATGIVMPSIVCPDPGCDFHEFVRLEGRGSA